MSLFIFDDGSGINPLDRRTQTTAPAVWTVVDVNRACLAHARVHGVMRTRSIILQVTGDSAIQIPEIGREHRGRLIAWLIRDITKRTHQAEAHHGQTK